MKKYSKKAVDAMTKRLNDIEGVIEGETLSICRLCDAVDDDCYECLAYPCAGTKDCRRRTHMRYGPLKDRAKAARAHLKALIGRIGEKGYEYK